tara:strand:- start:1142 stop:1423 length:282 start_codon:yes stop_codon:yes gene_type:complete
MKNMYYLFKKDTIYRDYSNFKMEMDLIHTMKVHGEEASYVWLSKVHEEGGVIDRERFVHLVMSHVLNTGPVPHFESVLKKLSDSYVKKNGLKF